MNNRAFVLAALLLLTLTAFVSCTSNASSLPTSGDKAFDETARYALHTIRTVESRGQFTTASEILTYMFSVHGSAELTPPNPDLEPMLAQTYNGPRPGKGVWLQSDERERNEFFKKHLVLSADPDKNTIIARAYREDSDEVIFEWVFTLGS